MKKKIIFGALTFKTKIMEEQNITEEQKPVQKKMIMALVCWLVGSLGVHRYMMGYKNWWQQLLLTFVCGIGSIWALIDLIKILTGKMKMADGRDLE